MPEVTGRLSLQQGVQAPLAPAAIAFCSQKTRDKRKISDSLVIVRGRFINTPSLVRRVRIGKIRARQRAVCDWDIATVGGWKRGSSEVRRNRIGLLPAALGKTHLYDPSRIRRSPNRSNGCCSVASASLPPILFDAIAPQANRFSAPRLETWMFVRLIQGGLKNVC